MKNNKLKWRKIKWNYVLGNGKNKVYLSYLDPNEIWQKHNIEKPTLLEKVCIDSANPETAIVLIGDKVINGKKANRILIFRGDKRKELEKLYPNIPKLKAYWEKYGGHFWSDNLCD